MEWHRNAERLTAEGENTIITAGFPCQDISLAGKGAGLAGARSGLVWPLLRTIRLVRPRFALLENVAALLFRGLGAILGHMAAFGYDAEWHCISASALGAPHQRDRIWIAAYPDEEQQVGISRSALQTVTGHDGGEECLADTKINGRDARRAGDAAQGTGRRQSDRGGIGADHVAHADEPRLEGWISKELQKCADEWTALPSSPSGADAPTMQRASQFGSKPHGNSERGWRDWFIEPDVGRVADGIPARVDRLSCLGNAVVPPIPEVYGRAILAAEKNR